MKSSSGENCIYAEAALVPEDRLNANQTTVSFT